jgi:predicted nucleotide-binding protein
MVSEKRQGKSVEEFLAPQRRIFLVHGRDMRLRKAMVEFMNALDLRVVSWTEALVSTGLGTPYTGDVVVAGMAMSDAVVVLLTPDDLGKVKPDFLSDHDGQGERELSGQPRMNVIFEAGMAMARDRVRTVLVEIGSVHPMTDTEGLNVVRFGDGEPAARHQLASRLKGLGLQVDMSSDEWLTAGDFSVPLAQPPLP